MPYWSRSPTGGKAYRGGTPPPPFSPPQPPGPPGPPDPPVPPVDPLAIYSDLFDGPSVNALWTALFPERITLEEIVDGQLRLGGLAGGPLGNLWFDNFVGYVRGPLITGDCLMRAFVQTRNYAGDGPPPLSQFRLGGASAHDPARPPENYLHIATGCLVPDVGASYQIEMKNNQNDVSNYFSVPWDIDAMTELALQKIGQIWTYAARTSSDDPFTILRIVDRTIEGPPMPETSLWGLISYSNDILADVSITSDGVLFSTPGFNGGLILPTS
jgi:hypothetical protein